MAGTKEKLLGILDAHEKKKFKKCLQKFLNWNMNSIELAGIANKRNIINNGIWKKKKKLTNLKDEKKTNATEIREFYIFGQCQFIGLILKCFLSLAEN